MAYTRKEYVGSVPLSKITIFQVGDPNLTYDYEVTLTAKNACEVSSSSLESIRIHINRSLAAKFTKSKFYFKIPVYPHQIVRAHSALGFAGADRISKGMQKAFGKPKTRSAMIKRGRIIAFVRVMSREEAVYARAILGGALKKIHIEGQISTKKLV